MWLTREQEAAERARYDREMALALRERYAEENAERDLHADVPLDIELLTDLDADRFWEIQEQKALEREQSAYYRRFEQ